MAMVDTSAALREAQQAWEDGFSIVASALNAVLKERCSTLSIASPPPSGKKTLPQCRLDLLDALRRSLVPLPEPDRLDFWTLGHINGGENVEVRIGGIGPDPDEALKFNCNFLRQKKKEWTQSEWNNLIVLAVERDAKLWRDQFASHISSDDDIEAKATRESDDTPGVGIPATTPRSDSRQSDAEADMQRLAEALGDSTSSKVLQVASRQDMSASDRMRAIIALDGRFEGKNSAQWQTLLGVTAAAIRQTETWRQLHPRDTEVE